MTKTPLPQKSISPRKINKNSFAKAVVGSGGVITEVAKRLHVERLTVYSFIKQNEEFAKPLLDQAREEIVDMAEGSLFTQVKNNEAWATKFLLKTIGKDRGYVEKQEIEQSGTIGLIGYTNVSPDDWDNEREVKQIEQE